MAGSGADRLIDMIELLVQHPEGIALSDVARMSHLAKSVTHRLLTSLTQRGYVEQPPGRDIYRLSLKLAALGFRSIAHFGLVDLCKPVLDRLARDTGESVRMSLADSHGLTWVAQAQGARFGLRYNPDMGQPVVLHATATGRAWMATMPEEEALALVDMRGFDVPSGFGRQKVLTGADLSNELNRTRDRGYGLAVEEGEPGIVAVAMAIRAQDATRGSGTISVAGPVVRMSLDALDRIIPELSRAVSKIEELWPLLHAHHEAG